MEVDADDGCRGSDLESSGFEVDTGSECDAPSDSSSEINADYATEITPHYAAGLMKPAAAPATGGARPATGGEDRCSRTKLYYNAFFAFTYRNDYPAVVCAIVEFSRQDPPKGMGHKYMWSKSIQPHTLGEDLTTPIGTLLVWRTWVLWRARKHDWSSGSTCRQRIFAAEATHL